MRVGKTKACLETRKRERNEMFKKHVAGVVCLSAVRSMQASRFYVQKGSMLIGSLSSTGAQKGVTEGVMLTDRRGRATAARRANRRERERERDDWAVVRASHPPKIKKIKKANQ